MRTKGGENRAISTVQTQKNAVTETTPLHNHRDHSFSTPLLNRGAEKAEVDVRDSRIDRGV